MEKKLRTFVKQLFRHLGRLCFPISCQTISKKIISCEFVQPTPCPVNPVLMLQYKNPNQTQCKSSAGMLSSRAPPLELSRAGISVTSAPEASSEQGLPGSPPGRPQSWPGEETVLGTRSQEPVVAVAQAPQEDQQDHYDVADLPVMPLPGQEKQ